MLLVPALVLAPSAASAATVSLTTDDGVALKGDAQGTGAVGVLLVHQEGGSRGDWATIAPKLAQVGQVLSLDLRGHGASGGAPASDADWNGLAKDVRAGVAWLGAHGATEIHVVGARVGAALALVEASADADVDDLVLLSPTLSTKGVKISAAAAAYGPRPLLVVTGAEDALGLKAATWLDQNAAGHHRYDPHPDGSSGAALFQTVPDLQSAVLGWIGGEFDPSKAAAASLQGQLRTGSDREIETTGTRLEERK